MQNTIPVRYETADFICGYDNEPVFSGSISPHMHNGWEILFIKEGFLTYIVDGNTFDITPGSLVISRPGAVHMLHSKGAIHYERHSLMVTGELLIRNIIDKIPPDLHVLDVSDNRIILDLFERISYYSSALQGEYWERVFRALIVELWVNIHISTQLPQQPVASHSNTVVTKAVNYIKNHITEPLTVQQVSNALFITPAYLHQCFAKYMNVTPKQYIMLQKLQLVQQALSAGANPTEICRQYGFGNYSTFYRNYQKVYGCRPSRSPKQPLLKIEL